MLRSMGQSWSHTNNHMCRGLSEGYEGESGPHMNGHLGRGDSEG